MLSSLVSSLWSLVDSQDDRTGESYDRSYRPELAQVRPYRVERSVGAAGISAGRGQIIERGRTIEDVDDAAKRVGEGREIIAALGDRNESPAAALVGRRRDEGRQPAELRRGEAHTSERVVHVRIKAGRQEDQFRAKPPEHPHGRGIHTLGVRIGRTGFERGH